MGVHRIRLHGPWSFRAAGKDQEQRISLPSDEQFGPGTFIRNFGCPTNLNANDEVWLVLEGIADRTQVALNGEQLGEFTGGLRVNVNAWLRRRNLLEMVCGSLVIPISAAYLEISPEPEAQAKE